MSPASRHRALKGHVRKRADLQLFVLMAWLMLGSGAIRAEPHSPIRLDSNFDMQVLKFPASGKHLLIWLPSKYGIRAGNRPFAEAVQQQGVDYWLVDLHESYVAPTGRHAYAA